MSHMNVTQMNVHVFSTLATHTCICTIGREIFTVENLRGFVIQCITQIFRHFIFVVKGNCENFITVQFTYIYMYLCIKKNSEDNEMEAREKLRSIFEGLKTLQDGCAGHVSSVTN